MEISGLSLKNTNIKEKRERRPGMGSEFNGRSVRKGLWWNRTKRKRRLERPKGVFLEKCWIRDYRLTPRGRG